MPYSNRKLQIETTSEHNNEEFISFLEIAINRDCVQVVSRNAFNAKAQQETLDAMWNEFSSLHMIGQSAPDSISDVLIYGGGVNK